MTRERRIVFSMILLSFTLGAFDERTWPVSGCIDGQGLTTWWGTCFGGWEEVGLVVVPLLVVVLVAGSQVRGTSG